MTKLKKFISKQNHFQSRIYFFLFLTVFSFSAIAQKGNTRISGFVVDERTREPIVGATVSLVKEKNGVIADVNGNFTLSAKSLPTTIIVSYLGYKTEEVDVYEYTEPLTILLRENHNLLNEVVVVGYGTQKRKELTGSISSVSKQTLEQPTAISFNNLLGGAVAGLNVTENSGQPGSTFSIRIRGANSINAGNEPLYVIDGLIVYGNSASAGVGRIDGTINALAAINPSDIESIEVLKDVSATAIYGSRGSNGVIIINTKNGKKGKNNIEYQYSAGWQQVRKKLDFLNAQQWAELNREIDPNGSPFADKNKSNPDNPFRNIGNLSELGKGIDWQDAALQTAPSQSHQLTISGGDDKTRYLLSANYTNQDGIILNTNFKRYNGRFNFDRDLFKNLTVGVNITAGKLNQNSLSDYGGLYVNSVSNSFEYVLRMPAVVPIYNEDGSYNYNNYFEKGDLRFGDQTVNAISDLYNNVSQTYTNSFIGNFYIKYTIISSLVAKISAGTSLRNSIQNFFSPASAASGFYANSNGYASIGNNRYDMWQYEYTLNYSKQLNPDHYVDILVGLTNQKTISESSTASASNFANDQLTYHSLSAGSTLLSPSSSASEAVLNSILGRVNYSYLGRYNLTATFRGDGSSRFADKHKWGYFPSIGLSWNISEESFLKKNKIISDLKLRTSAGIVGNQEIGNYQYAATYSTQGNYSFNNKIVKTYGRGNAGNADLRWEQTSQYNVGVDVAFFRHRLSLVADAYYKKTTDLLYNLPSEITTGFSSQLRNVGSLSNKGVEFEARGTIIDRKEFNWNISGNIARNVNKVLRLSEGNIDSGSTNIQVGKPLGYFYTIVFDGIVQSGDDLTKVPIPSWKTTVEPGDVKYVDQNKDGKIDTDNDRIDVGSRYPDFIYGFSTSLRYKSFDLFASFQGNQGNYANNSLRLNLESPSTSYNVLSTLLDRWTPTNPSNTVSKAVVVASPRTDNRYIEDASYLRLKNITLGYTLPVKIEGASSTTIKLFASAQNLVTITKYTGYDPEATGAYPAAKTFTFGVAISY
jgi:TonB-linked SusC/RagA family outer membrane protein